MPKIEFLVGEYWLTMHPQDYITNQDGTCFMCLFDSGQDPMWILGANFLRGYYSMYDYRYMRFGFAPHSTSLKAAPEYGEVPSDIMKPSHFSPYSRQKRGFALLYLIAMGLVLHQLINS